MQEINDKTATWDQQIDRFLKKEMSTEEEQAFMNQLDADNEMKNYVAATALLISKLRQQGQQQDHTFQQAAQTTKFPPIHAVAPSLRGRRGERLLVGLLAIAASACAFFGNSYLLRSQAIQFSESTGIDRLEVPRGEDIPNLPPLIDNVIVGKDLPNTLKQLEAIFVSLPEMDTAEYRTVGWYLAIAYIKDGQNEEAQAVLQKTIKVCPNFNEAWQLRDKLSRTFFWQ